VKQVFTWLLTVMLIAGVLRRAGFRRKRTLPIVDNPHGQSGGHRPVAV
jgi:hypothetical protein